MKALILWLTRVYVRYFVAVDRKEKCPCCGLRQFHPMRYDTDSKKVLHMCKTQHAPENQVIGCGAVWAVDPLVNAANWEVVMRTQDADGRTEVGQPDSKFTPAQREPIIIKTNKEKTA